MPDPLSGPSRTLRGHPLPQVSGATADPAPAVHTPAVMSVSASRVCYMADPSSYRPRPGEIPDSPGSTGSVTSTAG